MDNSKLEATEKELEELKDKLKESTLSMLERGDNAEQLLHNTEQLKQETSKFRDGAQKLRQSSSGINFLMWAVLVTLFLVVVVLLTKLTYSHDVPVHTPIRARQR